MKLFLQIDIGEWKSENYKKPLVHFASSLADDIIGTDIDNQSESTVLDIVLRLIDQTQTVFIVVLIQPETTPGGTEKIFHHIRNLSEKVYRIILSGENDWIATSLKPLSKRIVQEQKEEEIRKHIEAFANS